MVTKKMQAIHPDLAIHPGEVLAEELEARSMTQRALAQLIGRPEQTVSEIVRGKKGITAETALQLAAAFGTSAEFWMNLQSTYELTLARGAARRGRTQGSHSRGVARPAAR
jgi:HTH-type transcriptional regulator/antitoxin HigA